MCRTIRVLVALSFLTAASAGVHAAGELEYEARTGVGYTDNIGRTEVDAIDETVGIVGLEIDYEYLSRGVELGVLADLEYRYYAGDSFDNDTFGSLNADLVLNLTRDVLSWGVEQRLGHVVTNPFAAETPRTRERINTIATGPNVRVPLGGATALGFIGRIGSDNFSVTDADNDNLSGQLLVSRALSRNRSLSFNITADRVEFDNSDVNSSFDRQTAFIGFTSENSRGSVDLSVGQNELHDRGTVERGSFIGLELSRRLTDITELDVSFDRRLTFASELFQDFQTPGPAFGATRNIIGVADPLELTRASVALNFNRGSNELFVAIVTQKNDFISENGFDRSSREARIGGMLGIGPAWRLFYSAAVRQSEFDQDPREDDDLTLRVGLQRQITSSLRLRLDFTRLDRDSNTADASYTENAGFLTVRYGR